MVILGPLTTRKDSLNWAFVLTEVFNMVANALGTQKSALSRFQAN